MLPNNFVNLNPNAQMPPTEVVGNDATNHGVFKNLNPNALADQPTVSPQSSQVTQPQGQPTDLPTQGAGQGFIKGAADIAGVTQAGQGLATAGRVMSGHINQTGNEEVALQQQQQSIINAIQKQTDPVLKAHLINYLHILTNGGADPNFHPQGSIPNQAVTQGEIDPGTQLSNKQVLGSFGNVALDVVGAGSLPGEGAATGALSKGVSLTDKVAEATGATGKALKAVKLGTKVAEGTALGYGMDVANAATQNKEDITKPGLGTATGAFLPILTKALGATTKGTAALMSGTGTDVINRALQNPDAVATAAKKYASTPELEQSLVSRAKAAVFDLIHQKSVQYGDQLSKLTEKAPLDSTIAAKSFDTNAAMFGGKIENGALKFENSALTDSEQKGLQDVYKTITGWTDNSVKGMDNLRQRIGNEMDNFKVLGNSRSNALLDKVQQSVTDEISNKVPGYTSVLQNYGANVDSLKNLTSELANPNSKAKSSTQLKNVLNIFKKDPSVTQDLYKAMGKQKGDQFLNDVAGNILSEWMPSGGFRQKVEGFGQIGAGVAALSHPGTIPGMAVAAGASSPRVVGKIATTLGKATEKGVTTGARRSVIGGASKLNQ